MCSVSLLFIYVLIEPALLLSNYYTLMQEHFLISGLLWPLVDGYLVLISTRRRILPQIMFIGWI